MIYWTLTSPKCFTMLTRIQNTLIQRRHLHSVLSHVIQSPPLCLAHLYSPSLRGNISLLLYTVICVALFFFFFVFVLSQHPPALLSLLSICQLRLTVVLETSVDIDSLNRGERERKRVAILTHSHSLSHSLAPSSSHSTIAPLIVSRFRDKAEHKRSLIFISLTLHINTVVLTRDYQQVDCLFLSLSLSLFFFLLSSLPFFPTLCSVCVLFHSYIKY